jgi:hypothetical protein
MVVASAMLGPIVAQAPAATFGIESFTTTARNADGTIDELAGSHPFSLEVHASVDRGQVDGAEDGLHQIQVSLPPGLVGVTSNVPRCSVALPMSCSGVNQIGVLRATLIGVGQLTAPLYNVTPDPGYAAAFAVTVNDEVLLQRLRLRGSGSNISIQLSGTVPPTLGLLDVDEEIWGVPSDSGHDPERGCPSTGGESSEGCTSGPEGLPLLALPTSCSAPLLTTLTAVSAGPPPISAEASAMSRDAGGNPRPLAGCEAVPFDPRLAVQSDTAAMAPSALTVEVEVPQYEGTNATAAASVAGLRLELPSGLALNPAAGAWLGGCAPAAIGLLSPAGIAPPVFDEGRAECPSSSLLGKVRLQTPLVDRELGGSIYLATPGANPSAARYAIYLVIEDEASGTVLKIPGRLNVSPGDGRLAATIPELPPLPFESLKLEFSGGPQAPLVTPGGCGRYMAEATFTPSTAPFGSSVERTGSFTLKDGVGGRPCPPSETERNAAPTFQAGTEMPVAGFDSPLVVRLAREDDDQHLSSFNFTLPPGLIANLGAAPLGGAIGRVQAKVGVGPEPLAVDGTVYLEGPYRGAPYSLKAVVPAEVGPFDLGTITERATIEVDPTTAQISVSADPLPQILAGIPLQLRSIAIDLDRPGFIRNPTSCEPMAIGGAATSAIGQSAPLSQRFQVGACAALPFKPKLSLLLSGALGRNGHPAARAVLRGDSDGAALSSAHVYLPSGELLDLNHLRELCPWSVVVAGCPKKSRLGHLRLQTSLLGEPLEGPVYLRVPSHRLPELSAEVTGGGLRFAVSGRLTRTKGRLGFSLGPIPDVPLSEAVLELPGGRNGLILNSRSLCRTRGEVAATLTAHNGMRRHLSERIQVAGCH